MNQLNSYYEYVKSQLDLRIVHDKETEREREREKRMGLLHSRRLRVLNLEHTPFQVKRQSSRAVKRES